MQKVQPKEIRIIIDGGLIQSIGIGRDVPHDLSITLNDLDLDTGADDPNVEDNGYATQAYCVALHEPGDEIPAQCIDEDGTIWV